MRKLYSIMLSVMLLAMMAMAADAGKSSSMKGYVTDAKCAAKGKGAAEGHMSCAKACIKSGEKAVFVNDKDGAVYPIANQDAIMDHVGDHVQVQASLNNGALQISKIEAAK
jgi:hypothetical protein